MRTNKKVQIIVFKNQGDPKFLLLKTNQGEKSFWQGVTGGVESSDKSIEDAALREVYEELGLKVKEEDLYGPVHEFSFQTSHPDFFGEQVIEYCFGLEVPKNILITLSGEHQAYEWLSFKEAFFRIAHDNPKYVLTKIFMKTWKITNKIN